MKASLKSTRPTARKIPILVVTAAISVVITMIAAANSWLPFACRAMTKLAAAVGLAKYRNRIPNSGPRNPHNQAPRVASTGNPIIFTRLALNAISPLLRNAASDRVPPMQINARGNVIFAR
jgi:hypothetical protein